jgi:hypothetical protein
MKGSHAENFSKIGQLSPLGIKGKVSGQNIFYQILSHLQTKALLTVTITNKLRI